MKSCRKTTIWPSFPIIKVISLLLVCLLYLTMTYPALAMSSTPDKLSPQSQMKENQNYGGLPDSVLNAVKDDLAKRTNLPTEEFKLKEANRQTWPDGCLGLGKPDELCSQALVEGWNVVMARGKQTWLYRTDATGRVIRLDE